MLPLLSRFGAVTGIDSEPLALDYCRRRGMTDLHLQEGFSAAEPYDVVTLFDVLEHVPDEAGFLAWIHGLLRPGGSLVVTVPAFSWLWSRHDELNHHQRRYTRRQLVAALHRARFEVTLASYFNFWLFPAAVAVRLLDGGGRRAGSTAPRDPAAEAEEILKPLKIGPANGLLKAIFASEAGLVRRGDLPWGVSIGAVARVAEPGP
jgi:SAM-dependent methyltransferase